MTSAELTDWQAYNAVEPIGERATQATIAILSSMFYHAHRDAKSQPPLVDLDYFMVGDPGAAPQREESAEQKVARFKGALKSLQGQRRRKP